MNTPASASSAVLRRRLKKQRLDEKKHAAAEIRTDPHLWLAPFLKYGLLIVIGMGITYLASCLIHIAWAASSAPGASVYFDVHWELSKLVALVTLVGLGLMTAVLVGLVCVHTIVATEAWMHGHPTIVMFYVVGTIVLTVFLLVDGMANGFTHKMRASWGRGRHDRS